MAFLWLRKRFKGLKRKESSQLTGAKTSEPTEIATTIPPAVSNEAIIMTMGPADIESRPIIPVLLQTVVKYGLVRVAISIRDFAFSTSQWDFLQSLIQVCLG